jgi:hypothetical protein
VKSRGADTDKKPSCRGWDGTCKKIIGLCGTRRRSTWEIVAGKS